MPRGVYKRKPFSDKHRENLRKAGVGRVMTQEQKEKIRESLIKYYKIQREKNPKQEPQQEPRPRKKSRLSKECLQRIKERRKSDEYKNEYKNYTLNRKYGINLDYYNKLLEEQDGLCQICGKSSDKSLSVDHCHKTGKVRGLLCSKCNLILGLINDSISFTKKLESYLLKYS